MYKIKFIPEVYEQINRKSARLKIALALDITEQSVRNAIKLKRDILTKKAALDVIRAETGLNESELFESQKITIP